MGDDTKRTSEEVDRYNQALREVAVAMTKTMADLRPKLMERFQLDAGLVNWAIAKSAALIASSSAAQALGGDRDDATRISERIERVLENARKSRGNDLGDSGRS